MINHSDDAVYGKRIGDALRLLGLGHEHAKAARKAGVSPKRLNNLINGSHLPTREELRAFGKRLGISPEYILGLVSELRAPGETRTVRDLRDDLASHIERELAAELPPMIENAIELHRWRVWGEAALAAALVAMKNEAHRELARVRDNAIMTQQVHALSVSVEQLHAAMEAVSDHAGNVASINFEAARDNIRTVSSALVSAQAMPSETQPVFLEGLGLGATWASDEA